MTKKPALIIAIGEDMDDKKDKKGGMYFQLPDGVEAQEGETVTLPTESEFLYKDGVLCLKGVNTIDDKPAEPASEKDMGEDEASDKDEGGDEDGMEDETAMWRQRAMDSDQQLGSGNMA